MEKTRFIMSYDADRLKLINMFCIARWWNKTELIRWLIDDWFMDNIDNMKKVIKDNTKVDILD